MSWCWRWVLCWQGWWWWCLRGRSRSRSVSVAGVWQEASVPDGWFSIPHCQSQCHPRLLQNSQHLHQKSILSIALLPPQPDEGGTEREIWTSVQNFEPSLNLLTQSFRMYLAFILFPSSLCNGIKSSFQYCFPLKAEPWFTPLAYLNGVAWGGRGVGAVAVNQQTAHVDIFYCRYFIHN